MRAINHALTGAVIGTVITNPVVAIPVAVVSHFVCDIIPHYDDPKRFGGIADKRFQIVLLFDALLCGLLVLLLFAAKPEAWLLPAICAFAAAAPDFSHISMWLAALKKRPYVYNKFDTFASSIQWSQTPTGLLVELPWLIIFATLVFRLG